ncbi:hypothetical protein [Sphingosinicella terrae]|jgi:hypothetical protein|uniref:hypothetical protein n=1 Tax=Sphingosinicella terrae TaxID=2172047 RepID=UPI000E0D03DB|nr:hypothetical protein [Sphingosinicella terrae]
MNRLSPWIVRRDPAPLSPRRAAPAAMALTRSQPFAGFEAGSSLEDLKLFATGWIGGLIFFGTLFG